MSGKAHRLLLLEKATLVIGRLFFPPLSSPYIVFLLLFSLLMAMLLGN